MSVLTRLKQIQSPVSLPELMVMVDHPAAERTLRRWLSDWVDEGLLLRTGRKRSTRYQWNPSTQHVQFAFMAHLTESQREALTRQLRD
ncbi:MAG: hypothetical protein ACNYPE_14685, partial [Candidatus Azotimanducaceae bacterium WSBS_2022_MAG_OTU7]